MRADLPRLPYANAIVSEALRLYPPAAVLEREVIAAFDVGGYPVARGTEILVSPWVMHRDPRFFPDPFKFDPERWTAEAREARPKFSYFPFGGGPRVCIGEQYAWMEGALLISTIAQHWRMRLAPGQRVEPKAMITLRPRYGMRMIVEEREHVLFHQ